MQKRTELVAILFLLLAWLSVMPCYAISEEEEIAIGRQGAAQAEKKYGTVKDAAMLKRVRTLGKKIAAQGTRKLTYHFGILNSKEVNALAFPGGYIYFTKGIVDYMDDELLAFVAGHEVSHVEHRDSVKTLEKSKLSKSESPCCRFSSSKRAPPPAKASST